MLVFQRIPNKYNAVQGTEPVLMDPELVNVSCNNNTGNHKLFIILRKK